MELTEEQGLIGKEHAGAVMERLVHMRACEEKAGTSPDTCSFSRAITVQNVG